MEKRGKYGNTETYWLEIVIESDSSPEKTVHGSGDTTSTHTYMDVLNGTRDRLRDGGIPDWAASAEWLVTEALRCSRTELFSRGTQTPHAEQLALLEGWIARRLSREPVQYIVGYSEFCGIRLRVNPMVLIPRPETELLVESVVAAVSSLGPPLRILDIGTGSGCIALAVKKMVPHADVVASDYSDDVLAIARDNGRDGNLDVLWAKWDLLLDREVPIPGTFTAVVSNPPYIPVIEAPTLMPEVVSHEPSEALFVSDDPLLFYKAILSSADRLLDPGGYVFFEVNPDFALEVEGLMQLKQYASTGIDLDLAGHRRIVWGRRND